MNGQRPTVIANDIRMRRDLHTGTFILVEGRDDRLFFQKFFAPDLCKFIVAENKSNVCSTVCILDKDKFPGVVGLIDADYDHIEKRYNMSPNIIITNLHDIECIQIQSNGFDDVVKEFGSNDKVDKLGNDIRTILLRAASPIGYLRLYSERTKLDLRFNGLKYSKFIERDSLLLNIEKLIEEVKNNSNRHDITNSSLLLGIEEIKNFGYDPWQICTGADLLGILSFGLRSTLGNNKAGDVNDEKLRQALRLAYRNEDFEESEIKHSLHLWEVQNHPFKIF